MAEESPRPVILTELMRFACALAVMAYHYGVGFWRLPGDHPAPLLAGIGYISPIERQLQFGWLGVEIFFVISGLVIMRSLDGVSATTFARRRVLRLAPAAWICATVTFVLVGAAGGFDRALLASYARGLTFWPVGVLIDGSYWTLGIEIAFYGAVTISLATGGRAARVEALAIAIGLASLTFWLVCTMAGTVGAALVGSRMLALLLLKHGCFFALGAMIARCQADRITPMRLLVIAMMVGGGSMEVAVHAIESANNTGMPRAIGTALLLLMAAVALLAASDRVQERLGRWIAPSTARAVGLATYPLYLLHQDAGAALTALAVRVGVAPGVALIATAAVMIGAAGLIARTAEPMVRSHLRRLLGLNPRHAPPPDSPPTASLRAG